MLLRPRILFQSNCNCLTLQILSQSNARVKIYPLLGTHGAGYLNSLPQFHSIHYCCVYRHRRVGVSNYEPYIFRETR